MAVKVVPVGDDVSQIENEIKMMANLKSNYIVELIDVMRTSNNIYIVMEYCKGGDLQAYVHLNGRVGEDLAKKWVVQIIYAMINL